MSATDKYYPAWICHECGKKYGNRNHAGEASTWHYDVCGICKMYVPVTEPRDFWHLKKGWEQDMTETKIDVTKLHDTLNKLMMIGANTVVVAGLKATEEDETVITDTILNVEGDPLEVVLIMVNVLKSIGIDIDTAIEMLNILKKSESVSNEE